MASAPNIKTYTGGLAETNAYFLEGKNGWLVIDAPEETADTITDWGLKAGALVLTHGHWDHIWDAADIAERHKCPVFYHQADKILCTQPGIMRDFGLPIDLKPVQATRYLDQGDTLEFDPWTFKILHIPGHCMGSICLYEEKAGFVFGGDVLFAGAVGRWDLPGGSEKTLLDGIRKKLMTLPDKTIIYPGHGPETAIGMERKTNPFCAEKQ